MGYVVVGVGRRRFATVRINGMHATKAHIAKASAINAQMIFGNPRKYPGSALCNSSAEVSFVEGLPLLWEDVAGADRRPDGTAVVDNRLLDF